MISVTCLWCVIHVIIIIDQFLCFMNRGSMGTVLLTTGVRLSPAESGITKIFSVGVHVFLRASFCYVACYGDKIAGV